MFKKNALYVQGLLLVIMLSMMDGPVLARTQTASKVTPTAKEKAPNLEDHADYFAEKRKGISAENVAKADALRRKSISSISSLLESRKKSAGRFELQLRLGELFVERHDYLRDTEIGTNGIKVGVKDPSLSWTSRNQKLRCFVLQIHSAT